MAMCKGCNKVFGVLDMKDGYCKDCLAAKEIPSWTTLSENNTSEWNIKKEWNAQNKNNTETNDTEAKEINKKGNKMNKNVAIISIAVVIALSATFFIGRITSDRYYFMKERYSNAIIIIRCDKITGDIEYIYKFSNKQSE